jgi:hypothetical protein
MSLNHEGVLWDGGTKFEHFKIFFRFFWSYNDKNG